MVEMIRHAIPSDRDRVLMMAKAFYDTAGLPFAFSAPMADRLFRATMSNPDRLCLIYEVEGQPVGVLAAYAASHMFAPIKVAQEIMWWIDPAHRGRAAIGMLDAYEAWARERGCAVVHMVGLGGDPLTTKLYERRGFAAAERHFMKPL